MTIHAHSLQTPDAISQSSTSGSPACRTAATLRGPASLGAGDPAWRGADGEDHRGGDFDVVLVRKIGAPGNPEFAVGSVDESGWVYVSPYAASAGATANYFERQKEAELATIRERRRRYSPQRPAHDPAGRIVIVVDDGLATGATMIAALHGLRAKNSAKLVCAVPVASPEAAKKSKRHRRRIHQSAYAGKFLRGGSVLP